MTARDVVIRLLLGALALGGCGGDGDVTVGAGEDLGAAVLGVLQPGVDVADEPPDLAQAAYRAGLDGEPLVVRDVVRTDPVGFAEIAWFDGALARVDADTTYTLVEFDGTPGQAVVVTELDTGRIWNRLRDGVVSAYEVRTDVGVAAVRGTAFWVQCVDGGPCTFAVLEGEVTITKADGTEVVLVAGEEVTIRGDGSADPVTATDPASAWVVRNSDRDTAVGFGAIVTGDVATDGGGGTAGDELAWADFDCPFGVPDGWVEEVLPGRPVLGDSPCAFMRTGTGQGEWSEVFALGLDDDAGRAAILADGRSRFETVLARIASEPCAAGAPERFEEIATPIGDGELFGYWWRADPGPLPQEAASPCVGGQSGLRYLVVTDGLVFEIHAPTVTNDIFGACQSVDFDLVHGCAVEQHQRLDASAREIAAAFLGS